MNKDTKQILNEGRKFMKKNNKFLETALSFGKERGAAVLAGGALVGLVITAVAAYKAGIKAKEIMDQYHEDMDALKEKSKEEENVNEESVKKAETELKKDCVKKMAKTLAPTVIMGVTTGSCVLGSHSISTRKIAALSAVYELSERTVTDLNSKMKDILGDKKTKVIKDAIAKDRLDAQGSVRNYPVIVTGNGNVLCKDLHSGRFFRSDAMSIEKAILSASAMVLEEMYISVNDFYCEIGLEQLEKGDQIGWDTYSLVNGKLPIELSVLLTDDNEPCLTISFEKLTNL